MAKKKKPGKYLKFYYECMESGYSGYLCNYFRDYVKDKADPLLILIKPSPEEILDHSKEEGYEHCLDNNGNPLDDPAWGIKTGDERGQFNELRQNVVLFMACMNNEL